MPLQDRFDSSRRDVASFVNDDVFFSAFHPDITIVIDATKVAGSDPAVSHDSSGRCCVVPVAVHREWTFDGDLTGLAPTDIASFGVDDRKLNSVVRQTDRSGLFATVRWIDGVHAGFCHAALFSYFYAGYLSEFFKQIGWNVVATGNSQTNAAKVFHVLVSGEKESFLARLEARQSSLCWRACPAFPGKYLE